MAADLIRLNFYKVFLAIMLSLAVKQMLLRERKSEDNKIWHKDKQKYNKTKKTSTSRSCLLS